MRGFLIGLLLIAALFGLGYYLGWLDVGPAGAGGSKRGFWVAFDTEKFKQDLRAPAKDTLEQPEKNRAAPPAGKTIEGAIRMIDPARALVGIAAGAGAGKEEVMLQITAETRIKIDGEPAKTGDLKVGDRARAVYVVRDTVNMAESLTVTRK